MAYDKKPETPNPTQLAGKLVRGEATKSDCVAAAKVIRDLHDQVRDQNRRRKALAFEIAYALRENITGIDNAAATAGQWDAALEAREWYSGVVELVEVTIKAFDDKAKSGGNWVGVYDDNDNLRR